MLRLLRGEPVDAISREVSVPIDKLEQWRDRALAGIDAGLKECENDPVVKQLDRTSAEKAKNGTISSHFRRQLATIGGYF